MIFNIGPILCLLDLINQVCIPPVLQRRKLPSFAKKKPLPPEAWGGDVHIPTRKYGDSLNPFVFLTIVTFFSSSWGALTCWSGQWLQVTFSFHSKCFDSIFGSTIHIVEPVMYIWVSSCIRWTVTRSISRDCKYITLENDWYQSWSIYLGHKKLDDVICFSRLLICTVVDEDEFALAILDGMVDICEVP